VQEPLLREALATSRDTLGPDHPTSLNAICNLGIMLAGLGKAAKIAEAEVLLREALAGYVRSLGKDHRDTKACLDDLVSVIEAQGKTANPKILLG
jgi:hypothetical protein